MNYVCWLYAEGNQSTCILCSPNKTLKPSESPPWNSLQHLMVIRLKYREGELPAAPPPPPPPPPSSPTLCVPYGSKLTVHSTHCHWASVKPLITFSPTVSFVPAPFYSQLNLACQILLWIISLLGANTVWTRERPIYVRETPRTKHEKYRQTYVFFYFLHSYIIINWSVR